MLLGCTVNWQGAYRVHNAYRVHTAYRVHIGCI